MSNIFTEQFLEYRREYHMGNGLSEEEADEKAKEDMENVL